MTDCTCDYKRTIIRGDSDKFRLTFTKRTIVNGREQFDPVDITGWDIRFTVRTEAPKSEILDDLDAVIKAQAILNDPENGVAIIYVPAEDTNKLEPGTYYYDIQYLKPLDGFGYNQVQSIRKAKYVILGDITRDINYTIQGGRASDFAEYDETDYIVVDNVQEDEDGNQQIVPIEILNPCKGYNGGDAEPFIAEREIDGGNAELVKEFKYIDREQTFFDKTEEPADDGYEI